MRRSLGRRGGAALAAVALLIAVGLLTGSSIAGACEGLQYTLPGTGVSYHALDWGRYIDGVVTNNTSQTLDPSTVRITWDQRPGRVMEEWIGAGPLKPGEWAAFHFDRPSGIPTTWTPTVTGVAEASDASPLGLTVADVSAASTDDDGVRTYTVTLKNDNPVPVSSLDVQAIERDASSTLVDTLDTDCDNLPDKIDAGATAQITLTGHAPITGDVRPDIRVSGLEAPTLTVSADTTTPVLGTRVTFSVALTHANGSAVSGYRGFSLYVSRDGQNDWHDIKCFSADDDQSGVTTVSAMTCVTGYYKVIYWGGDDLGYAESTPIYISPVLPAAPIVPTHVHAHRDFKVSGRFGEDSKATVQILTERKKGSKWVSAGSASTKTGSKGAYSKSLQLGSAGTYRIRAYLSGVGYSSYRSVSVSK